MSLLLWYYSSVSDASNFPCTNISTCTFLWLNLMGIFPCQHHRIIHGSVYELDSCFKPIDHHTSPQRICGVAVFKIHVALAMASHLNDTRTLFQTCFSQSGHLQEHERIHTEKKLYICGQYGKSFTKQWKLRKAWGYPNRRQAISLTRVLSCCTSVPTQKISLVYPL